MSVSDELEIRNLVTRVAQLADAATDLGLYAAQFAENASWEIQGQPALQGRKQIRAGAAERRSKGLVGPGTNTRHVITTQTVLVEGDRASGQCTCVFYTNASTEPTARALSQYRDTFVRTAEGWKIARRVITVG